MNTNDNDKMERKKYKNNISMEKTNGKIQIKNIKNASVLTRE